MQHCDRQRDRHPGQRRAGRKRPVGDDCRGHLQDGHAHGHRRRWPDSLDFKVTSLPANGKLYEGTDTTGHLIAAGELPYLVSAADKVTFDPQPATHNGSDSFNFKAYRRRAPRLGGPPRLRCPRLPRHGPRSTTWPHRGPDDPARSVAERTETHSWTCSETTRPGPPKRVHGQALPRHPLDVQHAGARANQQRSPPVGGRKSHKVPRPNADYNASS